MTNPTVPWAFQYLDPESSASRLNQDFEALIAWATTEVVHTHHLDFTSYAINALAAGATQGITVTYGHAFPAGVTPIPMLTIYQAGAPVTGTSGPIAESYNPSNTGCTVTVRNTASVTLGVGHLLGVLAVDPTFNVSA